MPLAFFDCSVGRIKVEDCLENCPNENGRCLAYPTLKAISYKKEYRHGKFSTTLLNQPTRIAYLQLTFDYAVNPKKMAFMLGGTEHHRRLQTVSETLNQLKVEFPIDDLEISSCIDLLEPDELHDGQLKLVDYKWVGTYTVYKMLLPNPDYSGYDMQLNHYKTQLERATPLRVSRLQIQYTARDHGTRLAKEYGIEDAIGLIDIPIYPTKEVLDYFDIQRERLEMAMAHNMLPEFCDNTWNGRRCREYCSVFSGCPEGRKIHKLD